MGVYEATKSLFPDATDEEINQGLQLYNQVKPGATKEEFQQDSLAIKELNENPPEVLPEGQPMGVPEHPAMPQMIPEIGGGQEIANPQQDKNQFMQQYFNPEKIKQLQKQANQGPSTAAKIMSFMPRLQGAAKMMGAGNAQRAAGAQHELDQYMDMTKHYDNLGIKKREIDIKEAQEGRTQEKYATAKEMASNPNAAQFLGEWVKLLRPDYADGPMAGAVDRLVENKKTDVLMAMINQTGMTETVAKDYVKIAEEAKTKRFESANLLKQKEMQIAADKAAAEAKPTAGETSADTAYAADYLKWTNIGRSNANQEIAIMHQAREKLRDPKTKDFSKESRGFKGAIGQLPWGIGENLNPEDNEIRNDVIRAVSPSFREKLGGNMATKEIFLIIDSNFNPRLSRAHSAKVFAQLEKGLKDIKAAKEQMATYYENNRKSLRGYKGPRPEEIGDALRDEFLGDVKYKATMIKDGVTKTFETTGKMVNQLKAEGAELISADIIEGSPGGNKE